jgi:hypothetical protein
MVYVLSSLSVTFVRETFDGQNACLADSCSTGVFCGHAYSETTLHKPAAQSDE